MSDSREKLLEAEFFLERMNETQSDRAAFKYNLSAFLAAARSVTWFMQKEFKKVSGFKEWYEEKQAKMKSDSDMTFLNKTRKITIHIKPIQLHAHVDVTISAPIATAIACAQAPTIVVTKTDGTIERAKPEPTLPPAPTMAALTQTEAQSTTTWRWHFDDLPDREVITFCEEQVSKIETLVAECESQFSS